MDPGNSQKWLQSQSEEIEFRKDRDCGRKSWANSSGAPGLTLEEVTSRLSHTATWFSWMGTQKTTVTGRLLCPKLLNCTVRGGGRYQASGLSAPTRN